MRRREKTSGNASLVHYLKRRVNELASASTRSKSDPLGDWAVKNIRLDNRPFSFVDHEYLRPIYDDQAQHIVLCKAAQIGGTVWALIKSLHACMNGLNVIYFFPSRADVLEFSKSRVGPFLTDNPVISKQMKDTDTAGLKQIGDAHLYFRGMRSSIGMKSVPADMIVFDELDESDPNAKVLARERVSHSDFKRIVELSNPSLPDYGIDEEFQKSDQRHWTVKCSKCGEWTALVKEFPKKLNCEVNVILPGQDGSYYRACKKCGAELDMAMGEWVPDFPGREIHGYLLSQLHSAKVDPGEILNEYQTTRFADRFYNMKIGVPFADLERRLDMTTILSYCCDTPMEDMWKEGTHDCVMGVDTGKQLHAVILQKTADYYDDDYTDRLVHIQTCSDFSELDVLMKKYRVGRAVIDGLPETHATRAFANRNMLTYLSYFNQYQRKDANWNHKDMIVEINRTDALDASRSFIRDGRLTLPRRSPIVEEFARHLSNDAKVLDENPDTGALRFRYIKTGVNHYSLAFTYATMASSEHWVPRITWIG